MCFIFFMFVLGLYSPILLFFLYTIINGFSAFLFCALLYISFPTRSCFAFAFHRLRGLVILNTGFASHPFRPLDPLVPVCAGFMYLLRHPQFSLLFFILTVPFSSCSQSSFRFPAFRSRAKRFTSLSSFTTFF